METRKFRPLSDEEKFTLETLILYSDQKVSFALIGDRTAVTLAGVKPTDGKKVLRMKTKEAVDATLHTEDLPTDAAEKAAYLFTTNGNGEITDAEINAVADIILGKAK